MFFRRAQKRHSAIDGSPQAMRDRRTSGIKKALGMLASAAVVTSSVIVAGAVTAAPAFAADPFLCTPGAVFVQSATEIREFDVNLDGGANGNGGTLGGAGFGTGHSDNGLGISAGGRYAYTVTNTGRNKRLAKHDRVTDTTTRTNFTLDSSVLRGAVHPGTGVYYFASATVNNGINLYAWNESVTPQTYVQVGTLRPSSGSPDFGANGDMAFSASGQLVIVADQDIYSADIPLELTQSTATISAKQVHDMGDGVQGNGIAFGNLGHIFVSVQGGGNRIIEVDLPRGVTVNTTSLGTFAPTDMASCTFPNTLTLKKDVPNGRQAATDQFALQVDSPAGYQVPQTTVTTTGNVSGVQNDYAGPIFTNQGDTFGLSEAAAGTTDLDRYASSLSCEQQLPDGSTAPVAVTAGNRVVQPQGSLGTDVVCTFANERLVPNMELRKTSDPGNGAALRAGQVITYTVEAENTGNTVLDPVTISDDLTDVRKSAEYQNDVKTSVDGTQVASGAAAVDGNDLTWTGALEPGQTVTVTYSVIVNDGVAGEKIANSVTASGTPPGPFDPLTPPTVTTENPVAGFEITKSANPASGTVVEPGQTIEYAVTASNTGSTVLNPVTIADNLASVLAHAQYNDDILTRLNGVEVASGAATISGDDLSWSGALQPGDSLTIVYSVTVDEDASGQVLSNTASGSATPTTPNPADPDGPQIPGEPIDPPSVTTQHPVIGSGFTISKSADPASGTAVEAGDTIEYTIIGTNTGDTELDPAEIVDDLSAVLENADYNDDVAADRGTASLVSDTLTWNGSIPQGESVTITYSVTVADGVRSALLRNTANGEATPQIPVDPSDPESPTTPGTPLTPPQVETTHPVVDTGFDIEKTADPASGTAVRAGDTITYIVTGTNTGNTDLDPVSINDDLSAVLSSAQYNGDVAATTGDVEVDGTALNWSGALEPGDEVVITYTVTVNDDATGVLLRNTVEGEATPLIPEDPTDPESPTTPGQPVTPPPANTEHPVINPGFEITKSANPATGTSVDPGSVIEYTVTGTNTGDTVLDPIEITDDLSGVLAHAGYNDDVSATSGAAAVEGDLLTWNGTLAPGADVVVTYSVTVNPDAGGEVIANSVRGEATPLMPEDPSDPESPTTPGVPLLPPTVTTEHPVNAPGFTFSKSVDPSSGTAVDPGQVLTYTLTGINTGETALNPVDIVDDLSGVLENATYNDDAAAAINEGAAVAPTVAGDELSWSGALEVGESVTITYSVTVGADAVGTVIENSATGSATPPGGETITPPPGTTTTPVNMPGFSVSKSADPATGTAVDPGSVITYTVTGVNTGETVLDPVTILDDVSGVLAHAEYNDDATATIGDVVSTAPSLAEGELSWTGVLEVGETVTITYSVTVNGDAGGEVLQNIASGTATPPGGVPPIETPPAITENPVNAPGFEIVKSADPSSGTRVDPGSVITYTVTGINTGQTVLEPVTIADDLSDVLAHAVYNDDATASIGENETAMPEIDGDVLSWQGALQVGERVTITYSVTVNGDAGGDTIANVVSGVAVPPGGVEITPPPADTEHPVGKPGFDFAKTSNPGSGSAVAAGSVVTYTLTGVNTGETGLNEVVITDDLSKVLPYAEFNDDVTARVGDREVAAPVLKGTELMWTGSLAEGETVTVTYSVTVKDSAAGQTMKNVAVASAIPPGGETITPPPGETEHAVLTPLAITGGQIAVWSIALAALLLLTGGALMVLRHRRRVAN